MANLTGFVKRIRDIMRNDAGINGDAQRIEQMVWMLFLKVYDAKEESWEFEEENYESIIPENLRWRTWATEQKQGSGLTGNELLDFVNNELFRTLKNLAVTPQTPSKKKIVKTVFKDANNYMKDGVLLRQIINVINELDFDSVEETHAFGNIYESILKELQNAGSAGEFYTPRAVTDFMVQMIQPKIGEQMADFACGTGGFLTSWKKELDKIKDQRSVTASEISAIANSTYGIEKKPFPYMLCVTNMLLHDIDNPNIHHDNTLENDLLNYSDKDRFDVILMNPPYGGSEQESIKKHFPDDLSSSETADLFMAVIMYRLKQKGRAAVIIPDGFLFGNDTAKTNIKKKLLTEFNLHTVIRMPQSVFAPYTSITTNILFFDNTESSGYVWFYRLDMPEGIKHFSKTKPMKLSDFDSCVEWWNNRKELFDEDKKPKAKKYSVTELIKNNCNLDLCGYPHEEEVILSLKETIQNYEEKRSKLNSEIDSILNQITELHNSFARLI